MKTRLMMAATVLVSLFWGLFAAPDPIKAQGVSYIVVRIDEVSIDDDTDHGLSGVGEIQYLCTAVTGNRGGGLISMQQTPFPMEGWYEAEDDGVNRTFLSLQEQAVPCFEYPEDQMGDELVIDFVVLDDDAVSEFLLSLNEFAAVVSTAVTSALSGPIAGGLVGAVSYGVQAALEGGAEEDVIGHLANTLRRADNFGMDECEGYCKTFTARAGHMTVQYTVMRVSVLEAQSDWCIRVSLDRLRIMNDGDDFWDGAGEVFARARVAGYYTYEGELLQTTTRLAEEDVSSGDNYPRRNVELFNECGGLPPFLYIEVDVFESDGAHNDVLGILALMYTNRWMRENPGESPQGEGRTTYYDVKGSPASSDKACISLIIDIWDPTTR